MPTVDRESQRTFDSIEYIGYFGGGGKDGVGACSRGRKWEPVAPGALLPGRRTLEEEKNRAL